MTPQKERERKLREGDLTIGKKCKNMDDPLRQVRDLVYIQIADRYL